MTFVDAAIAVLRQHGAPMTAREITTEAMRRDLLEGTGKTPEATMGAALYMHIKIGEQRVRRVFQPGPSAQDELAVGIS